MPDVELTQPGLDAASHSLVADEPNGSRPSRSIVRQALSGAARLLLLAAFLPPIGWIAGRVGWLVDLLAHFPLQAASGAVVAAFLFGSVRRWKFFFLALLVAAINAAPLARPYLPVRQPESRGATLRICAVNTFIGNTDIDRILRVIREENPDVVYVSELSEVVDEALRESGLYPHRYSFAFTESPWGAGIFSRFPIRKTSPIPTRFGCPTLVCDIDVNGSPLTVVGAHPPPPANGRLTRFRNGMLAAMGERIATLSGPVVLCGDLNTTPWSHSFRDLVQTSGLREAGLGFGIQTTWPTQAPLLRIPIDHVLVSPGIAVRSHRVAARTGSDHFPVVVDLQLPQADREGYRQPSDSAMR